MNKSDYYRAQGRLEAGKELSYQEQISLMAFTDSLVGLIESSADDWDDLYGTEGWEHAIGWD